MSKQLTTDTTAGRGTFDFFAKYAYAKCNIKCYNTACSGFDIRILGAGVMRIILYQSNSLQLCYINIHNMQDLAMYNNYLYYLVDIPLELLMHLFLNTIGLKTNFY